MSEIVVAETKEIQTDWYQSLIDDCQSIIIEAEFTSRWSLVVGYHSLGLRILQDEPKIVQGGSTLRETLQHVAKLINRKERTLYNAVKFAKKYPELDLLPEGKDTSWRKICNEYLPEHKEPNQPEFDENIGMQHECPKCGYEW